MWPSQPMFWNLEMYNVVSVNWWPCNSSMTKMLGMVCSDAPALIRAHLLSLFVLCYRYLIQEMVFEVWRNMAIYFFFGLSMRTFEVTVMYAVKFSNRLFILCHHCGDISYVHYLFTLCLFIYSVLSNHSVCWLHWKDYLKW